jgi:hypothetical protein
MECSKNHDEIKTPFCPICGLALAEQSPAQTLHQHLFNRCIALDKRAATLAELIRERPADGWQQVQKKNGRLLTKWTVWAAWVRDHLDENTP